MRENRLLPKRHRRYVITTNSDHESPIFSDLARDQKIDGARPNVSRKKPPHCAEGSVPRRLPASVSPGTAVRGYAPRTRLTNSSRVRGSSRITPSRRLVVSVDPSVFTPRNVMQLCSASITPCGSRTSWMASAISAVSFSWICSRRAKRAPSLLRQLPLAECCVVSRPCGGKPWLAGCRLVPMPLRLRFHFPMLQNLRANCLRLTPRWTLRRFMHSTFACCGRFRIFAALGFPLAGNSQRPNAFI
jgi:hypothetical protein